VSHLLAFLCSLAGFLALALAMDRPQETLFCRHLSRRANAALRLALGGLISRQGWSLGLVMFSGHTSLAAGMVFCLLVAVSRWRNERHRGL